MSKILVIGQAPPIQAQTVPYDTTLFYTMLEWVGVTKGSAQELFKFAALLDEFPGKTKFGGHKAPTKKQALPRVQNIIIPLADKHDKIILFGLPVQKTFFKIDTLQIEIRGKYYCLPHPSKRNWNIIMNNRDLITDILNSCLYE